MAWAGTDLGVVTRRGGTGVRAFHYAANNADHHTIVTDDDRTLQRMVRSPAACNPPLNPVSRPNVLMSVQDQQPPAAPVSHFTLADLQRRLQTKIYARYKNFREAFLSVDVDRSGSLDRDELRVALIRLNVLTAAEASSGAVDAMFDLCDRDGNGQIDYEEFASSAKAMDGHAQGFVAALGAEAIHLDAEPVQLSVDPHVQRGLHSTLSLNDASADQLPMYLQEGRIALPTQMGRIDAMAEPISRRLHKEISDKLQQKTGAQQGEMRRAYQLFTRHAGSNGRTPGQGRLLEADFFGLLSEWSIDFSGQERQALWARLDRNGDGHVSMAEFGAVFFQEPTSDGSGQVLGGEHCDPFMQHPTNRGQWSTPAVRLQCEFDGQPQAQAGMANDIYPRPNALTRHYETQPVPHYPGTNGLRQTAAPGLSSHDRVINAARQVCDDCSGFNSRMHCKEDTGKSQHSKDIYVAVKARPRSQYHNSHSFA